MNYDEEGAQAIVDLDAFADISTTIEEAELRWSVLNQVAKNSVLDIVRFIKRMDQGDK